MSNWITRAKEREKEMVEYMRDLENKNKFLRKELAELAAGLYFSEDASYDITTRLKLRASKALSKESEMKNAKCAPWVF